MAAITSFDHVGITVDDLELVIDFFVGLGLELEGRTTLEGDFVDTVIGITGAKAKIAMLRPPGGGTGLELSQFINPEAVPGAPDATANVLGLRSMVFQVDDLPAMVDKLAAEGYQMVGGLGEYPGIWRMAYIRGPEGLLVPLAERIG